MYLCRGVGCSVSHIHIKYFETVKILQFCSNKVNLIKKVGYQSEHFPIFFFKLKKNRKNVRNIVML
jgi:hypothetical protein